MKKFTKLISLTVVFALVTILFGCSVHKPEVLDGPDMMYQDTDYRPEYANLFDFDSYDGQPHFAVAFLGYGISKDSRDAYVEKTFETIEGFSIDDIEHIDYEGDEWYLIVPRYKEYVEITDLETGDVHIVYQGVPFTVKCNLSDIHSNITISTEEGGGAHIFSPQVGGDGKIAKDVEVMDITDY